MPPDNEREAIEWTRRWIAQVVIGLNLCPFARRVFDARLIRSEYSHSTSESELLNHLRSELKYLATIPRSEVETTILIHPHVLTDFLDYNDFLHQADKAIRNLKLRGVIQIASFHPDYQFEGTSHDDVENYSNRSPFPMLHLLREESITELNMSEEALLEIPKRNIEILRIVGTGEMLKRNREIKLPPEDG